MSKALLEGSVILQGMSILSGPRNGPTVRNHDVILECEEDCCACLHARGEFVVC